MAENRQEFPIAHLYAPRFPHEMIEIIGNKSGLERLINVMIDALSEVQARDSVYTCDGHDSEVRATCLQGRRRPEEWTRAGAPCWDLDDPLVARILVLTEENERLRRAFAELRCERKSMKMVDHLGATEAQDHVAGSQD